LLGFSSQATHSSSNTLTERLKAWRILAISLNIHLDCGVFLDDFAEQRSHVDLKSSDLAELITMDRRVFIKLIELGTDPPRIFQQICVLCVCDLDVFSANLLNLDLRSDSLSANLCFLQP
jgi:hypothetical protein